MANAIETATYTLMLALCICMASMLMHACPGFRDSPEANPERHYP